HLMKHLFVLKKYFIKYKWRLLAGMLFVALSNLFAVVSPIVVREVLDEVQRGLERYNLIAGSILQEEMRNQIFRSVFLVGLVLLGLALVRSVFMFFMRQTIIVMSRHIEYDQKKDIYDHYQSLNFHFYKTHYTGDLMTRIS